MGVFLSKKSQKPENHKNMLKVTAHKVHNTVLWCADGSLRTIPVSYHTNYEKPIIENLITAENLTNEINEIEQNIAGAQTRLDTCNAELRNNKIQFKDDKKKVLNCFQNCDTNMKEVKDSCIAKDKYPRHKEKMETCAGANPTYLPRDYCVGSLSCESLKEENIQLCKNGGTCSNTPEGPKCTCIGNWKGRTCAEEKKKVVSRRIQQTYSTGAYSGH